MFSRPDNGGGVEGNNQLGFAKFKFNPITPGSSAGFGSNSSSTVSTTALPNPPVNTTGNVGGFTSGLFGTQTANSGLFGTQTANSGTTSAVATQPPPFGPYQCGDHLYCTNPTTGALSPCQNSTCAFHQPSNSVSPSSDRSPFSSTRGSHIGGQHSSGLSSNSSTRGSQIGGQHSIGCCPFSSSNSSTRGSQIGGQHSIGWTPFSSGSHSSNSSTVSPFGGFSSSTSPFGVQHFSSGGIASTSPFGPILHFGGSAFPTVDSGFGSFTTSSSTGDQLYCTNPTTGALFSSALQQPSNSVPSSSLFSNSDLFASTKCSQSGGQNSSGCSPFSSGISSSPIVSQLGGQHSSGWSPFSFGISSSPAVARFGGQQSSGRSPFSSGVSQLGGQHSTGWSPFPSGVSQLGGQHSSGWSPFSSGIFRLGGQNSNDWSPFSSDISRSPTVPPFGVPCSSSTSPFSSSPNVPPFGVPCSSSTSPFGFQHCSSSVSSATTSPFGTKLGSSLFTFPTTDSGLGGFTTSSTGPFTRSLAQENTSADNVSVFAPYSQGTRIISYATTPEVDNSYIRPGMLTSISAMPFYNEKNHEELRLEDYQLTGKTGSSIINTNSKSSNQHSTSANNVSVFATFTNSDQGRSGFQGTKWSYETSPVEGGYATSAESSSSFPVINISISVSPSLVPTSSSSSTGAIPGFSFSNPSASDSLRFGPSVSSTCTSHIPTSSLPLLQSGISFPLSIEKRLLGDLLATAQTTIPVPTSGTVPASKNATVTESIITSLPEPVSTGGFTPRFRCSTDSRQTPVRHIFLANPVATEARVTLPTTVQYGISGLPVSENAEPVKGIPPMMNDRPLSLDQRTPPIEKYKPDDEDVMAMIPKLKCPEYYMEPSMDDLAENELKMPGFCRQVRDFVIGKRGYGSIKFMGETDVRNLELESMVQFNTREVIFCMDKKAKPPVGQGLNKAAEITLLNVNCIDKNTGKQYIDGPKVDKYKQLLVRETVEQGAEFVSFDPAKGEWKFKVQHF